MKHCLVTASIGILVALVTDSEANAQIQSSARESSHWGFSFDPPPPPPPDEQVPPFLRTHSVGGGSPNDHPLRAYSSKDTYSYADSKTLVAIYTNYRKTALDSELTHHVGTEDLAMLRDELAISKEFIWRNSHMRFNMRADVVTIDRELYLDQLWQLGNSTGLVWLPYWSIDGMHSVSQDLAERGLLDEGYTTVVVLYAWKNTEGAGAALGGGTYGVGIGSLGGAAYIGIPLEWGIKGKNAYIVHEYLHAIGSMFEQLGMPEFPHADRPTDYGGDYSSSYDFNAWILRSWPEESWLDVGPYAEIRGAQDADADGIVDTGVDGSGVPLPITEESFGSDATLADTDSDGLGDRGEVMAWIFSGSDPNVADTDGDGLMDGQDPYPLFPLEVNRRERAPVIDGVIGPNEHVLLGSVQSGSDLNGSVYLSWRNGSLFIAAKVIDDHVDGWWSEPVWNDGLMIHIDAESDGFVFHGQNNFEIYAGPKGSGGAPFLTSWNLLPDGSKEQNTLPPEAIGFAAAIQGNQYTLELSIPEVSDRGFNLRRNATFGIHFEFVDFDSDEWSWRRFDPVSGREMPQGAFVDLTLIKEDAPAKLEKIIEQEQSIASSRVLTFQNGICELQMQNDGNLVIRRYGEILWTSGSVGRRGEYFAIMQADGNFVIYRGTRRDGLDSRNAVYATHTVRPSSGPYFLAVHEDCRLSIYQGTFEDDHPDIEKEIWTNIKANLASGNRLQKGEMLRSAELNVFMIFQHDGNMVVHRGLDWAERSGDALWAAGSESSEKDFFMKVQKDGNLVLYEGNHNNVGRAFWALRLDASGKYWLGFDPITFEPIAKPLPPTSSESLW